MSSAIKDSWEVIANIIDSFGRYTRPAAGDVGVYSLIDPLRQIFVNGPDYKVVKRQNQVLLDPVTNQPTQRYANFSRNIHAYLRNLFSGFNSNLSESHANWIKDVDTYSGKQCWYAPSAYKAALFARNDANQFPWTAALASNGALANVVDLAINPNQRERDLLSNINLNPIVRFPEGNQVYNTLTLQSENTALRENYIRRGLLWLGKSMQTTLRQFIGKPNTIVTRTRVKNSLIPVLEFMKNNSGLYDYLIVCDERNNTADTIDKYQLNVAVYVKPVKTIKFILANIIVTNTSVDFTSLL
jgi:phage tail sheath protein FI